MTTNPHDFTRRCGRPTAKGTPCQQWATLAVACARHETEEEWAARVERRTPTRALVEGALADPAFPACWSWAPVALDVFDREGLIAWHDDRCAMCGRGGGGGGLVEDHDHESGTVRGWLCQRCNVREGLRGHLGWLRYRWRNPGTITGVEVSYSRL